MNLQAWKVAQWYKTLGLVLSTENKTNPNCHQCSNKKAIQTKKLFYCQKSKV